jgi:hypothetical protein
MIFWALIIVVSVKYVLLIIRADNQGEGGISPCWPLPCRQPGESAAHFLVVLLALGGGALFYGGSMITPTIPCSARSKASHCDAGLNRFVVSLTVVVPPEGVWEAEVVSEGRRRLPSVTFQPDTRHVRNLRTFDKLSNQFFHN